MIDIPLVGALTFWTLIYWYIHFAVFSLSGNIITATVAPIGVNFCMIYWSRTGFLPFGRCAPSGGCAPKGTPNPKFWA